MVERLTEAQRRALSRLTDDWGPGQPGRDAAQYDGLARAGLITRRQVDDGAAGAVARFVRLEYRRTAGGRAALAEEDRR